MAGMAIDRRGALIALHLLACGRVDYRPDGALTADGDAGSMSVLAGRGDGLPGIGVDVSRGKRRATA
jgi:hypothetical protein